MSAFDALLQDASLAKLLDVLPRARLVGGCVRDTLAGLTVADVDLAHPDTPDAAAARLEAAGLRVIPTGLAHGTLTVVSGGQSFELTTLRRDDETDGRHARVSWTDSFAEDAARRDFTINAMSVDRAGVLHDYFGGQADLAAGLVRFVGEAAKRVAEDYLRILRFFRFHARYARGAPDAAAVGAIVGGIGGLAALSAERVWSELRRILAAPAPGEAVALMERLGVLDAVLPDAGDIGRLQRLLAEGAPADPLLRLAALLTGDAAGVARRLRLSVAERDTLAALSSGAAPEADWDDARLRRALAETEPAIVQGRAWLAGTGAALQARLAGMVRPVFPLEGRHVLALGALPGPGVGEALRLVRDWWLETGCLADRDGCLQRLGEVLSDGESSKQSFFEKKDQKTFIR